MPFACPAHQRNFTAYLHRFHMPFKQSGAINNLWYSHDVGLLHMVAINTETDFPNAPSGPGTWLASGPFGDQVAWLRRDLAKAHANRMNVPWIIVGGHRPFYTSRAKAVCQSCAAAFEKILIEFGVDMYLSGHVHWMERISVVSPGGKIESNVYVNPKFPVYLINGAAGQLDANKC